MKVLIACEWSGTTRDAFAAKGHDAWSCDVRKASGKHFQGDVFKFLDKGWDLMIAHPPCQHLTASNGRLIHDKVRDGRSQKGFDFVNRLVWADIPKICIENPAGILTKWLRPPDQYIHPYMFGDPYMKRTGLWLFGGLPLLKPTNEVKPEAYWVTTGKNNNKLPELHRNSKKRAKSFEGIAQAMADQWGNIDV